MAQDLRSFLDLVKRSRPEDFQIISRPVDPAYEITALVVKLEKEARRRPVVLFENVKGSAFPVLTNLHASRSRLATAIGAAPEAMLPTYLRAMERPIPPRIVASGPVKEVVRRGKDVDLGTLPQIVHHQGDAGPYVTAAISFAKDPASETWNCAYNRLMLQGRDTTSIHLTLGKHLWEFSKIAEARNEPLPVAFAIGVHPAIALGALAIGSIDEDERAIMGALLGEPLELVKCETSDVLVPGPRRAGAGGRDPAGRARGRGPLRRVHRLQPGRAPARGRALHGDHPPARRDVPGHHRRAPRSHAAVDDPDGGQPLPGGARHGALDQGGARAGPFTCYVSIEQRLPGQAKNAIMAVLGADLYMKRVVVVDHDVDVFDDRQVNWAIATRCQPDRDITIITNARGSDLDPSSREDGYTAKWGVDATAKPSLAAYTPRHRVPPEVWQRLDLEDYLPEWLG